MRMTADVKQCRSTFTFSHVEAGDRRSSRKDRRLHGDHPGLRQRLYPGIQFASRRSDLAFLVDTANCILHTKADLFSCEHQVRCSTYRLRGASVVFSESAPAEFSFL